MDVLDILIAHKAINLVESLTGTDRRVAGAILAHYNLRTAQCDPSLARIARLLLISTRTVVRSVKRLVAMGLFRSHRHRGKSQRNSYEPMWSRFRDLEAQWQWRFAADRLARDAKVSPDQGQRCAPGSDEAVTQTHLRKHIEETHGVATPSQDPKACAERKVSKGHSGEARRPAYRPQLTRSRGSSVSTSAFDAARAAAERRWNADLNGRFAGSPDEYAIIIEALDDELGTSATAAEMKRHGAGIALILTELTERRMRGAAQ
jgi:hypothetical protein